MAKANKKTATASKRSLDQRIFDALKAKKKPMTAYEVWSAVLKHDAAIKLTSIRRALMRMWTDQVLERELHGMAASTYKPKAS